MNKNIFCLITTIFIASFIAAQRCPNGYKWDFNSSSCITLDEASSLPVVHHKCPNGYSYVEFKKECLTNKKVKEIYDSLKIEYLKSPKVKNNLVVEYIGDDSKNPTINEVPTTPAVEEVTTPVEIIPTPVEIVSTPVETVPTPVETVTTPLQSTTATYQVNSQELEALRRQVADLKENVQSLKTEVNALKQVSISGMGMTVLGTGSTSTTNTIYGQTEEVEFFIECPEEYLWHEEESICLHQNTYNKKVRSALDTNSPPVTYGPKDVKCPSAWRWNSTNQNCIPTVGALKQ